MVKATRRVKCVKRSKKQVHHGRRKTNRHRHTRRQRGGAKIPVCARSGSSIFAKGIAITYDTDSQKYTIGNHPYAELKTMDRYIDALSWVEVILGREPPDDEPVVLNQDQFTRFKQRHCPQGSTKPECGAISKFSVPSAVAPAAPVAAASAAADPDDDEEKIKAEIKNMNVNELRATERIIAFKNNEGAAEHYPADKSKTEYNFGNFKINLGDSVRTGNLHIKFVNKEAIFTLTLDVNASDIISCMQQLIDAPFSGAQITSIESVGFFPKKLKVTGVLTENGDLRRKLSTYNLNSFVQEFKKRHQECSDPATQMADLRVAGPADLIHVINSKIGLVNTRIPNDTNVRKFTELQQKFLRANNDMEVLKQIDKEMGKLLDDTRRDPRRPPPSAPVNRRSVPPHSVPGSSFSGASAPPGGGGKTRRKHRR